MNAVISDSISILNEQQLGHTGLATVDTYFISGRPLAEHCHIDLKTGQKLFNERFTIEELLGRGAYSSVYRAYDSVRTGKVALKIVNITSANSHLEEAIKNELMCYSSVRNFSHIIRVHDMHICDYGCNRLLLLSMEYANDGTFRKWLTDNAIDSGIRLTEGLQYFKQACLGITALHDAGIVHLDLKPENLLFVDGAIKVSDLGISRYFTAKKSFNHTDTSTSESFGTPVYMSPEQFAAAHPDQIDIRADIYSLGIMLFEIAHPRCRPPFGGTYRQIRMGHLLKEPDINELPDTNAKVVVKKCLSKNPADRYKSITELIDDLEGNRTDKNSKEQYINQQKVSELWSLACEDIESGNFNSAAEICRRILEIEPGHAQAHRLQREINTRYHQAKQFYKTIEDNLESGSLDDLLDLLREAVELFPNHPDGHLIQIQLAAKARRFKEAINEGIKAMAEGKVELAESIFEKSAQLNADSTVTTRMTDFSCRTNQWLSQIRSEIDLFIEQENWPKALLLATEVDQRLRNLQQLNLTDLENRGNKNGNLNITGY
ncbi:MAG: protein kinase [Phycisphaerae bacterium]|nr:protein kinase [Phycisphaerae bacterium]